MAEFCAYGIILAQCSGPKVMAQELDRLPKEVAQHSFVQHALQVRARACVRVCEGGLPSASKCFQVLPSALNASKGFQRLPKAPCFPVLPNASKDFQVLLNAPCFMLLNVPPARQLVVIIARGQVDGAGGRASGTALPSTNNISQ